MNYTLTSPFTAVINMIMISIKEKMHPTVNVPFHDTQIPNPQGHIACLHRLTLDHKLKRKIQS